MNLKRQGREYYKLGITTSPATLPTAWEASFDGGTTWVAAIDEGGDAAWLVYGPAAPAGTGIALTASLRPLVRLADNPETVVRDGPHIYLQ